MKRLITILLFLSAPAFAAVAWNSNSTSFTESGTAASPQTNTKMTVGSGSNRALLCLVSFDKAKGVTGTITVNWDSTGTNQAMTLLSSTGTSTGTCSVYLYGLVNPTSGNKTFRVAWTVGTADLITWCSDFTGVIQTNEATAFVNAVTALGTSTTPAITITSAVGDLTVDGGNESAVGVPTTPTKTLIFNPATAGASNPFSSRAAGAASNVHSWTVSSVAWAETGIDIVQAPAGTFGFSKVDRYGRDE